MKSQDSNSNFNQIQSDPKYLTLKHQVRCCVCENLHSENLKPCYTALLILT